MFHTYRRKASLGLLSHGSQTAWSPPELPNLYGLRFLGTDFRFGKYRLHDLDTWQGGMGPVNPEL